MENFEIGVACCWRGYKFVAGELGMKCLTCGKVMTNQSWEEKGKCFSGHTNAVPAIAINPMSSRNPTPHILPGQRRDELRLQDPPPVRPRRQLQWRDPPPVRPRRQLQWRDAKTKKWKYIAISAIGLVVLLVIIFILKK